MRAVSGLCPRGPLTGWDSCSRLSPYLAWGHVSLKRVFQALTARQEELRREKQRGAETGPPRSAAEKLSLDSELYAAGCTNARRAQCLAKEFT